MVPGRFVVEYPQRCLELLSLLEPEARQRQLVGSFSLLVASAIFVIPYERLKARHPLARADKEAPMYEALRRGEKQRFLDAEFWNAERPDGWRFSRILSDPGDSFGWKDEEGRHPMSNEAQNSIGQQTAERVLRVIRNALAHGNILYLSDDGRERRGERLRFLAFLARYEESESERLKASTFRLVAATEEAFLVLIKAWGTWLQTFPDEEGLLFDEIAA